MSPGLMMRSAYTLDTQEQYLIDHSEGLFECLLSCLRCCRSCRFGITISVSTAASIFLRPSSAFVDCLPSKLKGFVTIPTVRIPIDLAISAITGADPVPVPPPRPHVMNTISASWRDALISSELSSAAFLPISGSAPAPSPLVMLSPMLIFLFARFVARFLASVLTAKNSSFQTFGNTFYSVECFVTSSSTSDHFDFAPGINSVLSLE